MREPHGFLGTIRSFASVRRPKERIGTMEEVGHLLVSTVYVNDLKCWETAVICEGHASPVERYDTKEDAVRGHERWIFEVPYMNEITKLGYGDQIAPKTVRIR
jgi:hypothetical protein